MNEIQALLERQARWQKTRRTLSWPEKIRMAEEVRETARHLRPPRTTQPVKPTESPSVPAESRRDSGGGVLAPLPDGAHLGDHHADSARPPAVTS